MGARSEILELDDRKRMIMEKEQNKQRNSKKNNQTVNKGSIAYMSRENVKDFNKVVRNRVFNPSGVGRPYAFSSMDQLKEDIGEYFDACNEYDIMPTVSNLALWLGVNVDTLYEHKNNSMSPFSEVIKNVFNYMHSLMQGGTLSGDINPVTYIFLSKNYYGMRDDKNIQVSATNDQSAPNAEETANALRKQLEEETIPAATISEEQ